MLSTMLQAGQPNAPSLTETQARDHRACDNHSGNSPIQDVAIPISWHNFNVYSRYLCNNFGVINLHNHANFSGYTVAYASQHDVQEVQASSWMIRINRFSDSYTKSGRVGGVRCNSCLAPARHDDHMWIVGRLESREREYLPGTTAQACRPLNVAFKKLNLEAHLSP